MLQNYNSTLKGGEKKIQPKCKSEYLHINTYEVLCTYSLVQCTHIATLTKLKLLDTHTDMRAKGPNIS